MEKESLKPPLRMFVTSNHPKASTEIIQKSPATQNQKDQAEITFFPYKHRFFLLNASKSTW